MSDTVALEDIDGVGPSVAEDLDEAGFTSVDDVATATIEELEDVSGFVANRAESIRSSAQVLSNEPLSDEELDEIVGEPADDLDTAMEQAESGEGVEPEEMLDRVSDEIAESFEVDLVVSDDLYRHVLGAAIEEMTRSRQRSDHDAEESMRSIVDQIARQWSEADDADEYEFTILVTMDELNLFHQGLSSQISDYRARAGLPKLWGDLEQVKGQVDEARSEHHGK